MKSFNQNFEVRIAEGTMDALKQAHNIDFYDCALVRAHIAKINEKISASAKTRNEVYGAVFAAQLVSIFRRHCANGNWTVSNKMTYNRSAGTYSFDLANKISSGYSIDHLGFKTKTFVKFIINVTVAFTGQAVKVVTADSYEFDKKTMISGVTLKNISVVPVPNTSLIFGEVHYGIDKEPVTEMVQKNFVFEGNVLRVSNTYYGKMLNSFQAAISEVKDYLANFKLANGNFLNALNFCYPRSYYSANSYQIISAVWRKAIVVFPMFKKLSSEKQAELLEKAFSEVKKEIGSKQLNALAYAQAIYYQIVDNNLDNLLAVPRGAGALPFPAKKKVCARWGREDNINAKATLLTSDEEFEQFDHSKMAPSELVWVQYGSQENRTTYLVGELWHMIAETFTPNSAFNIVSVNIYSSLDDTNADDDDTDGGDDFE